MRKYLQIVALFSLLWMGITPAVAIEREDCGSRVGSLAVAGDARPTVHAEEMRVYPLHIGDTLVPYEQFYGGTELSGFAGAMQLFNSERFLWVPLYMFLIDHPVVGPFVVDTAVNEEMVFNYEEYFSGNAGGVSRLLGEEYRLEPEQTIPAQLARLGYTPADIQLVVLTHSHDDHVGGLAYFQHARIVLAEAEFKIIEFITANTFLPVNTRFYEGVTCWEPITFTDGVFHSFDNSQDLLGDGSVIILPTPGHSDGSLSVVVNMGDYYLLLPGDTIYTMRHLDPTQVLQFIPDTDPSVTMDAIERLNELREQLGSVVVVPSHDHTGYIDAVLPSLVSCGWLNTEERERVITYETTLFDEAGQVNQEFLPQYIAAEDESKYGEVSGIDIALDTLPVCEMTIP